MTTYIESKEDFLKADANDAFDWEIPAVPDLAGLEYGSTEETDALEAILSAFEKFNNVELGWEARNAWEEVARVYYNSIS